MGFQKNTPETYHTVENKKKHIFKNLLQKLCFGFLVLIVGSVIFMLPWKPEQRGDV